MNFGETTREDTDTSLVRTWRGTLENLECVQVQVVSATGLKRTSRFGLTNPYVELSWDGEAVGRTSAKKNTLSATWHHETFEINLSKLLPAVSELVVRVIDQDFFSGGTFLGEAIVPGELLLHPPDEPLTLDLQPLSGDDPVAAGVKGQVTIKLTEKVRAQRLRLVRPENVDLTEHAEALDPVEIRPLRDPDEEVRRQKRENLDLPSLVARARDDAERYAHEPFVRLGTLSESHFGQVFDLVSFLSLFPSFQFPFSFLFLPFLSFFFPFLVHFFCVATVGSEFSRQYTEF
jgi:hypothetical protein